MKILKSKLTLTGIVIFFAFSLITGFSLTTLPDSDLDAITQILGEVSRQTFPENYYLVTKVVDGDTIKVDIDGRQETVRLAGIDTPETKDPRKKVQCFGLEASNKLETLVANKPVRLEKDSKNTKDRYNRLLRYIYLEDQTFVNAQMVGEGYAFAYTKIDSDQLDYFRQLEKEARDQDLGLWSACKTDYQ